MSVEVGCLRATDLIPRPELGIDELGDHLGWFVMAFVHKSLERFLTSNQ